MPKEARGFGALSQWTLKLLSPVDLSSSFGTDAPLVSLKGIEESPEEEARKKDNDGQLIA